MKMPSDGALKWVVFRVLVFAMPLSFINIGITVAEAEGMWCSKGVFEMSAGAGDVKKIYQDCKPGDLISIPGNSAAIGVICDFSKTIYLAPSGTATCVLGPLKEIRR